MSACQDHTVRCATNEMGIDVLSRPLDEASISEDTENDAGDIALVPRRDRQC
jgi:hypothetical protein